MKVGLRSNADVLKEVKVGFSWTTFFFGFIPALIRGDLKWALIMVVLAGVAGVFTLCFGAWIPGIVFSFVYNKISIIGLMEKGYASEDELAKTALLSSGIIAA